MSFGHPAQEDHDDPILRDVNGYAIGERTSAPGEPPIFALYDAFAAGAFLDSEDLGPCDPADEWGSDPFADDLFADELARQFGGLGWS